MKRGIDIYASQGTIDALSLTGHRLHAMRPMGECQIGPFTVMPFDVDHDAPDPLGFLIQIQAGQERLLYVTDTPYIKYRFPGLTCILVEANYDLSLLRNKVAQGEVARVVKNRVIRSHLGIDNVLLMLRANDLSMCREIWLLHLSDSNADAEDFRLRVERETGIPTRTA